MNNPAISASIVGNVTASTVTATLIVGSSVMTNTYQHVHVIKR